MDFQASEKLLQPLETLATTKQVDNIYLMINNSVWNT